MFSVVGRRQLQGISGQIVSPGREALSTTGELEAGPSLVEIKTLRTLQARCGRPDEAAYAMTSRLQLQIDQLTTRMEALKRVQSELISTVDNMQACLNCRDDSFPEYCKTCEVTEQPDAQRVMHLLWKN